MMLKGLVWTALPGVVFAGDLQRRCDRYGLHREMGAAELDLRLHQLDRDVRGQYRFRWRLTAADGKWLVNCEWIYHGVETLSGRTRSSAMGRN